MGGLKTSISLIVTGLIIIVIGLALSGTVLDSAVASGGHTGIGSFGGTQAMNDLIPLLYYVVIVSIGVGLIAAGGYSGYRKMGG